MECDRLKKLIKNWYVQVQDEAMAPARMVDFMRSHIYDCLTCMADPIVEIEIKRITEMVLPPTKIPKAVRKEKDLADSGEEGDDGEVDDVYDDESDDSDDTDVEQDEDGDGDDDLDEDEIDLDDEI